MLFTAQDRSIQEKLNKFSRDNAAKTRGVVPATLSWPPKQVFGTALRRL